MAKLPLESIPTERSVLGSIIKDPQALWGVKERARPELFVLAANFKIMQIIHELVDLNRDVSIAAIVARFPLENGSDFSPAGYISTIVADDAEPEQMLDLLEDLEGMWARRQMMRLGQELIEQATADNGLGALERLDAAKANIEAINDPMGTTIKHISTIAQSVLERVSEAYQNEATVGLEVGIAQVQTLIGSLMPGRTYLVGGAPGSGKTALAQQIGMFAAQAEPVLFIQIEMPGEEMVERDLAGRSGVSSESIERATINQDDIEKLWDAAEELQKYKFYIDESTSPTVSQIRAKAMRMKRTKGLGALIIDHLLYIGKPDKKTDQFEAIGQNLKALKRLAKDLQVPVIILTQLKTGYDSLGWDKIQRPGISNLWGGSALEQDVDVILLVHREEYLLLRKEPAEDAKDRAEWEARLEAVKGKAELVLLKRKGGKGTGIRTVYFDGPTTRFTDKRPPLSYAAASQASFDEHLEQVF